MTWQIVSSISQVEAVKESSIVVLGPQASPPARVETNQFSCISDSSALGE